MAKTGKAKMSDFVDEAAIEKSVGKRLEGSEDDEDGDAGSAFSGEDDDLTGDGSDTDANGDLKGFVGEHPKDAKKAARGNKGAGERANPHPGATPAQKAAADAAVSAPAWRVDRDGVACVGEDDFFSFSLFDPELGFSQQSLEMSVRAGEEEAKRRGVPERARAHHVWATVLATLCDAATSETVKTELARHRDAELAAFGAAVKAAAAARPAMPKKDELGEATDRLLALDVGALKDRDALLKALEAARECRDRWRRMSKAYPAWEHPLASAIAVGRLFQRIEERLAAENDANVSALASASARRAAEERKTRLAPIPEERPVEKESRQERRSRERAEAAAAKVKERKAEVAAYEAANGKMAASPLAGADAEDRARRAARATALQETWKGRNADVLKQAAEICRNVPHDDLLEAVTVVLDKRRFGLVGMLASFQDRMNTLQHGQLIEEIVRLIRTDGTDSPEAPYTPQQPQTPNDA